MFESYLKSQKILHWLLALLLLFWLFVSGELVEEAQGDDKGFILMFHSGGAIIILLLMAWRFQIRRRHPVSPMPDLKSWEQNWGRRVHLAFYGLVLIMVLSGLLQGMFFEQDVRVFGLINITIAHNEALLAPFHIVHGATANILKVLIVLHVLAALKHQFLDKRPFLKRMA